VTASVPGVGANEAQIGTQTVKDATIKGVGKPVYTSKKAWRS
jgi:hypothetical protein